MSYGEGSNATSAGAASDGGVAGTGAKNAANTTSTLKSQDASITKTAAAAPETVGRAQAPPPPPAPSTGNVFHSIGRFFKKLFGGH
jgi:hypothetical protein